MVGHVLASCAYAVHIATDLHFIFVLDAEQLPVTMYFVSR